MQTTSLAAVRRRLVRRALCAAIRTCLLTLYTLLSVPAVSEASPGSDERKLPTVWFSEGSPPTPWVDPASPRQTPPEREEMQMAAPAPDALCQAMCATRAYISYPYFYRNPLYGGGLAPRFARPFGGRMLFGGLARPAVPPVSLYPPVRPYGFRRSAFIVAPRPPHEPLFAPAFGLQKTIVPPSPPLYVPYGLGAGHERLN